MIIKENTIRINYENVYSLKDKKIGIPIFQRFYAWKEKEIIQFKEDLLDVMDDKASQLYLLDFIYYEEDDKIKLADGQQRLVTLNNLILAINKYIEEKGLDIAPVDLFDITYDIFANQTKYETHFTNYPVAPFKTVYLKLCEFVKENASRLEDMIDVIKNNIFVYMKRCDNADDAFNIFQQINTGGKPLSKDEVIKTALDQYSLAYGIKFDTAKMKEVRQSIISYYKLKSANFDKNFDNMEIITFLKDSVTKDAATFQDFVDTMSLLKTLENHPMKYIINYINRSTLFDVLNIMAMKHIDITIKHDYLLKVLVPLSMMSITLHLGGGSPTAYRYVLSDVIQALKDDKSADDINKMLLNKVNADATQWQIDLKTFTEKLGDTTVSPGIKKALLILDVICSNISGTVNVPAINLEHIYPQNPDPEWAQNGWPTSRDQQKILIDNIGNHALLCEEVNKSIQNQYITKKVARYKEIMAKDALLLTKTNAIDFEKFENDQDKYIKERQTSIAKTIQTTFPFGRVLIK